MFQTRRSRNKIQAAFAIFNLIYYQAAYEVRKSHRNALFSLSKLIVSTLIMLATLYATMWILGFRHARIRGDYIVYLLSGVFLYMAHISAVSAVASAGAPSNPLLKHPPLTAAVNICAAALAALYLNVLSIALILYVYHAGWGPIEIENWGGALGMLILTWFDGIGVGLIFLALTPWMPGLSPILRTIYIRVNMVASGKMFVANTMSQHMRDMFDWNPLFHTIDQSRGFLFLNYTPLYSNWVYAFWVGLALVVIGMMGEFYTRQRASTSWSARS